MATVEQAQPRRRSSFVALMTDAERAVKAQSNGKLREAYHFLADFYASPAHPVAQIVLLVLWATLICVLNDDDVLDAGLVLHSNYGRTLTVLLAFLIVFRTNQSYNRWWEGRVQWGKMHWSCVELTQQAAGWIDDPALATRIMNFAVAFAYAVKKYLRMEELEASALQGIVHPAEVDRMRSLPPAVAPYYCTDVIRECIKKGLTLHPQSFGAQAVARGIDINVSQLAAQYADMARIRHTPQPGCFRVLLLMFSVFYLMLLPLISHEDIGYWVILEVLLTSYLMLGLQMAASHLEDPFGYDLSDLELDQFVSDIASQCRAAYLMGKKGGFDLTLPDGGAMMDEQFVPCWHDVKDSELENVSRSKAANWPAMLPLGTSCQPDASRRTGTRGTEVDDSDDGEGLPPPPPPL